MFLHEKIIEFIIYSIKDYFENLDYFKLIIKEKWNNYKEYNICNFFEVWNKKFVKIKYKIIKNTIPLIRN